jgi:transposase
MPEKNAELVEGLILKPGAKGRRTYSLAAKRALVELCNRPGLSVAGMALAHGINANLLRRWMVQYSAVPVALVDKVPDKSGAALLPVTTSRPAAARPSVNSEAFIEISFMGATLRVRGAVDARVLEVSYSIAWHSGRDQSSERHPSVARCRHDGYAPWHA